MGKTTSPCRIAIIGAGPLGTSLAKQLVSAGHTVTISNSRGPDSLRVQEKQTGATAMDICQAARNANVVILGVPQASILKINKVLQDSVQPGTLFIDSGNYYPTRDGRIAELDEGMSDSAWVSKQFSVPVVKALNNIIAGNIVLSARDKGSASRVNLPVSGDNDKAVEAAMGLVEDVGFEAHNAGSLEESWRYQPGQPAYCTEPSLEQLLQLLAKADRRQGPLNRDQSRLLFEKLPADFPPHTLLRVTRLWVGLDRWDVRSYLAALVFGFVLLKASILG